MLKKILLILVLPLSIISKVNAWNFQGHVLICQIAYNNLSTSKQNEVEKAAKNLISRLPQKLQAKLSYSYSGVSAFAKTCVLPDMWRLKKLSTVFRSLDIAPPITLYPFLKQNTAKWHYYNKPYSTSKISKILCHPFQPNNVIVAISVIKTALKSSLNQDDAKQGLLNAFLGHYVGDAHQPLHTMVGEDSFCHSDAGGNAFCLGMKNKAGKCSNNLHHLWDTGVGYVKRDRNLSTLATKLAIEFPKDTLTAETKDIDPNDWVNDNFKLASFIYSLEPNQKPSADYYRTGQNIARKQLILAGLRLAEIIKNDSIS